jgi:hypothetical protein
MHVTDAEIIDGFQSLLGATSLGFDKLDKKLAELTAHFTACSDRLAVHVGAVEVHIDGLEARLGARIDAVEARLGARIDAADRRVDALHYDMNRRFDRVDERFDALESRVSVLERRRR